MHALYIHLHSRFATKCNIFKKVFKDVFPQTYFRSSLLSLKIESKKPDALAGYFKEDFFNFLRKQDLSTLPNLQLTFIPFNASHPQTEKSMLSKTNQAGPMIFG